MSYPPPPSGPPPPPGPPPSGPPQGWPTYIPPAGPPRPPGPYGWPGPQPPYGRPPKRNLGLLIGGIALAVLLVAGAGVAAWLLLHGDNGKKDNTAGVAHGSPSASPTPATTPTPTATPSARAQPPARRPGKRPSKPPVDKNPGKLSASDFPGDWNFGLGGVQLNAKYRFSHDYKSCRGVGSARLVADGCRYAVQWTYTARGGKLVMTQVMYVMGSDQQAKTAAKGFGESDFTLPTGSELAHFRSGKWIAKPSTKVVVLSVVTTGAGVPKRVLDDFLHYSNADFSSALLFMSM